ncbi:hypothetical protein PED39_01960 [Methanomassiliicoccales archaeon LGM-RCC1]|nr:hypothetical protein PED39_01960 [Methanomassiliicoccales archaeon LGM-RCC1]
MSKKERIVALLSIIALSLFCFQTIYDDTNSVEGDPASYIWTSFPASLSWDPSSDYELHLTNVKAMTSASQRLSDANFRAFITLTVGDSTVTSAEITQQSEDVTTVQGSTISNGGIQILWSITEDSTGNAVTQKKVIIDLKIHKDGEIEQDSFTLKVSINGTKTNNTTVLGEKTATINVLKLNDVQIVCNGGVAYAYAATDVDTHVADSDNRFPISSAASGQLVRVSPFPSTNGMIQSIVVTDSDNNSVDVTSKSHQDTDGLTAPEYWYYFFTMPDKNVTITVTFNSKLVSISAEHGSVDMKLVANFLGPVRESELQGGAGYSKTSMQVLRQSGYYFNQDVIELTPTPAEGYVFKNWNVTSGGVTVGSDNRFTMGESAVTIEAVFEKVQDQPQVPEASSMTCSGIKDGSNIVLSIQIDGKSDVTSMQDPRLFITVKYGNQGSTVINYYSKPVLTNGSGSDVAIFSAEGLNQVVVQLVDGVTNGLPASYVCWCHYEPATA